MDHCPFCLLVFAAIQEQYKAKEKEMWSQDPYCLRWRYVATKVSRYEEFDGKHIRCIEILSAANCDAKALDEGKFRFSYEINRVSVRSLIAPCAPSNVDGRNIPALWARFLPTRVDTSRVKQWMKSCEECHGSHCRDDTGTEETLPTTAFSILDDERSIDISAPHSKR